MKFYLFQHGETSAEHTLHAFDTPADRDTATIKCIFGTDLTTQDEAEQWDAYRAELNDKGCVTFEGDPGLEWFTAVPVAASDSTEARLHERIKELDVLASALGQLAKEKDNDRIFHRDQAKRLRSALEGVRNLAAYRANQDQLLLAVMIRDEADAALKV